MAKVIGISKNSGTGLSSRVIIGTSSGDCMEEVQKRADEWRKKTDTEASIPDPIEVSKALIQTPKEYVADVKNTDAYRERTSKTPAELSLVDRLNLDGAKKKYVNGERLSVAELAATLRYSKNMAEFSGTEQQSVGATLNKLTGKEIKRQVSPSETIADEVKAPVVEPMKDIVGKFVSTLDEKSVSYLDKSEQDEYNRKKATDEIAAGRYLESKSDKIAMRQGVELAQNYINGNFGEKALNGLNIWISTGLSDVGWGDSFAAFESMITGKDMPKNITSPKEYANAYLANYFAENGKWFERAIQDIVVNASNNMAAGAPGVVMGALTQNKALGNTIGRISFALSVFGNTYRNEVENGYNSKEAALYALATTASETSLETVLGAIPGVGGEFVEGLAKKCGNAVGKFFIRMFGNAAGEYIEEGTQTLLDPFLRKWILGEDVKTVANDMKNQFSEANYSGIIGAISAVLMSGFGTVANIRTERNIENYGKMYKEILAQTDATVKDLAKYGLSIADKNSEFYKLSKDIADGKSTETDYNIGKLCIEAVTFFDNANTMVNSFTGSQIKQEENGVQDFLADFDRMVSEGVVFNDVITLKADKIRESVANGTEISDYDIGAFVRTVEFNTPAAYIQDRVNQFVKNIANTNPQLQTDEDGNEGVVVNSQLPSGQNGGIISENGNVIVGDDENDVRRGNVQGNAESKEEYNTENTRTTRQGTGNVQGNNGSNSQYVGRGVQRTGELPRRRIHRLKSKTGKETAISYSEKAADGTQPSNAAELLRKKGYEVYYCDSAIDINNDGISQQHNNAVTTTDGKIFISSNNSGTAEQTADHEEVHLLQNLNNADFAKYKNAFLKNIVNDKKVYLKHAQDINNKHFDNKYTDEELLSKKVAPKIFKELIAYLRQCYNYDADYAKQLYGDLFENWDEVSKAVDDFNAAVGRNISEERDGDSFFDEPSADFPKADFIADAGARLAGVERHSDGQREIIEIGRKLGYKVIFDPSLKTKTGAFANGKIDRDKKTIYINPKSKKVKQFIFKHELTHHLETNFVAYADFANAVMDSKAFKDYVISRGYNSTREFNAALVEEYNNAGVENFGEQEANYEMVADFVGGCLFTESNALTVKLLGSVETKCRNTFVQTIKDFFAKIKQIFSKDSKTTAEFEKLEKRFIKALHAVETSANEKTTAKDSGGVKYSLEGYAEDGKGKYKSNFPKGTPKAAKGERILNYIQKVWSKAPIRLKITENGETRYIEAKFDPTYDESGNVLSDASKLMGGNRHGTSSEQRVTLDLADDYYQIASESQYNYSKDETGKDNPAHREVKRWHYFINDIYFAEYGSEDYAPYRVSINVKERSDGDYVYSFSAEKQREPDTPRTLHAVVNEGENSDANAELSNNSILNRKPVVNTNSTQDNEKYSISADETNTELLARYERGEISGQELIDTLTRKKAVKETPKTIADLTEEDANTTPPLKRRNGINYGDKESKFYGSLLDSDIFDQRFKDEVETDTWIQSYKSVSNEETLKEAAKELDEGGRTYVLKWMNIPPERASLIDITVGFILMYRYQRIGDYDGALAVAEKLREFGTASGRQVQIFSIIGRFDPNMMEAYVQQTLSRAYEQMAKDKSQKWIDQNADKFELSDEEIEFIRRRTLQAALLPQDSRDKAIRLAEICQLLQDKIPASKGQKIRTLQRISMLLNVKTQGRNITGNAGMVPVFITSDFFGTFIDKAVSKKTNVRTTGNFRFKGSGSAIKKGLYESWDDFKRDIHTKQEELNRFEIEGKAGKSFNEKHTGRAAKQLNAIAKTINKIDRFTSFCLEAGDRPFFEMWLNNSLNNLMRINNVTTPTAEMIEIATQEALQRTWQDDNIVTRAVGNMKRSLNILHIPGTDYGLGDFVVKFVKTPANLAKAMVEFSPVGFGFAAKNAVSLKNSIETGQFTPQMQKEFVRGLSNAITGTLIYVAVFSLAGLGLVKLSGAGDDDNDVSNFERYIAGIPPYSMEIFGVNVTYDWMQPMGTVFAGVADFMKSRKQNPDGDIADSILQAIDAAGTVFTEQSFLKSFYEFFSRDGFVEGVISAALSEPSVFIPQFSSQIASFTDEKRRTTYDPQSDIKSAINKILIKIPGLRQKLPEQVNVLGETSENTQYLNPWLAFAAPYNTYPESAGKVADEVYKLYKQTGDKSVMPRVAQKDFSVKGNQITFNAEERANFQRRIGTLSAEMLSELFDRSDYSVLTDEQKIEVVADIYTFATAKAKTELDYSYEIISAMEGNRNDGTPFISKAQFKNMPDEMKKAIAEDYFLSKIEKRFGNSAEKAVGYYVEQAKK